MQRHQHQVDETQQQQKTKIDSSINIIANIQNDLISSDFNFDDICELNKCMAFE